METKKTVAVVFVFLFTFSLVSSVARADWLSDVYNIFQSLFNTQFSVVLPSGYEKYGEPVYVGNLLSHFCDAGDGVTDTSGFCEYYGEGVTGWWVWSGQTPNIHSTQVYMQRYQPIDLDNDGILNSVDVCPKEAGPISNSGCPVSTTQTSPYGSATTTTVQTSPTPIQSPSTETSQIQILPYVATQQPNPLQQYFWFIVIGIILVSLLGFGIWWRRR